MLAVLADFAGPLGPFQTPEEREARKQQWMDTVDMSAVDQLLAVVQRPRRPPELERLDENDIEFELTELLVGVGRRDDEATLARVAPLLGVAQARPVLTAAGAGHDCRLGVYMVVATTMYTRYPRSQPWTPVAGDHDRPTRSDPARLT